MKRQTILKTVVVLMLITVVSPAGAYEFIGSGKYIETWEPPDDNLDNYNVDDSANLLSVVNNDPGENYLEASTSGSEQNAYIFTTDTLSEDYSRETIFYTNYYVPGDFDFGGQFDTYFILYDGGTPNSISGETIRLRNHDNDEVCIQGSLVDDLCTTEEGAGGQTWDSRDNHRYTARVEIDWTNDTITVNETDDDPYNDFSTSLNGQFQNSSDIRFATRFHYTSFDNRANPVRLYNVSIQTADVSTQELEVDVNKFMKRGDAQTYEVTYNETLLDGTSTTTDVTNDVNVTSNNASLITVNEPDNELQASTTNVGSVNVTFEYQGTEENVTIFVGPRTISNIGELPSSQWFAAAMGFDEEGTWYVMGSEIQMILLAIFIGAATAWKARNEYLGIGVIILAIILFWTANHVSLGIVMVSVFYGLFAAYQQRQTPGRSDTNVNPNGGINPERFRR